MTPTRPRPGGILRASKEIIVGTTGRLYIADIGSAALTPAARRRAHLVPMYGSPAGRGLRR